jgi:hypothetical protein
LLLNRQQVVVSMDEQQESDQQSSREVHRQVLAHFKSKNKTFGPFDGFLFEGEQGVEAFLKSRIGKDKYSAELDAKHQERATRCRKVNAELQLMFDSWNNVASPGSTFGIGYLHCDMRKPRAAGGPLDFSNFTPLLGYVNAVIKGVREDDGWREHATNKGINLDILREAIYMGAVPKGQCGVQYTTESYSASLGFHVLTGKIMTAEELKAFKSAEGEAFRGSRSSESSDSGSGNGGGSSNSSRRWVAGNKLLEIIRGDGWLGCI